MVLKTSYSGKGYHWYDVTLSIPARTKTEAQKITRAIIGRRHIGVVKLPRKGPRVS